MRLMTVKQKGGVGKAIWAPGAVMPLHSKMKFGGLRHRELAGNY